MNRKFQVVIIVVTAIILTLIGIFYFLKLQTFPTDEWVKKIRLKFINYPCTEKMADILKSHHINHEQCLSLSSQSTDRCITKILPTMPKILSIKEGATWGGVIGKCIGADFYDHNLSEIFNRS